MAVLVLLGGCLPGAAALADAQTGGEDSPGHQETVIPRPAPNALTLLFEIDYNPVPGIEFRIWHVAVPNDAGVFEWLDTTKDYGLDINQEDRARLASSLYNYLSRDGAEPEDRQTTGENGMATFSNLPVGLHLVMGDACREGRTSWTPIPTLIQIEDGHPSTLNVKHEKYTEPTDHSDTHVSRKVVKVWKDASDGSEAVEQDVTVQLLKDGKVYDEQVLNEDNSWRHTWNGLDSGHTWEVVEEDVPDGYTVDVEKNGATFMVTNTKEPEPETPPPDSSEPTPPPDSSEPTPPPDSSNPTPPPDSSTPTPPPDSSTPNPPPSSSTQQTPPDASTPPADKPPEKLSQTGTDWLQTWILAGLGAVFCLAAVLWKVCDMHRESREENAEEEMISQAFGRNDKRRRK